METECLLRDTNRVLQSLVKRQFVVMHTIRQSEIPVLLDSWFTDTPCFKTLCLQI